MLPKQKTLLAVINSPFFLWLTSLIFLTVGGYTLTASQQCTKDALDEISFDVKIQREYIEREHHIRDIVFGDSTIAAVQAHLREPYNYYPEFKDYPTAVIREQYDVNKNRIINTGPEAPSWRAQTEIVQEVGTGPSEFRQIEDGILPPNIADVAIPDLRNYVNLVQQNLPKPGLVLLGRPALEPSCNILNVWRRALFGYQTKIVQGPVNREWSGPLGPVII